MTYLLLVAVVVVGTPLPFKHCCCIGEDAVDAEIGDDEADWCWVFIDDDEEDAVRPPIGLLPLELPLLLSAIRCIWRITVAAWYACCNHNIEIRTTYSL